MLAPDQAAGVLSSPDVATARRQEIEVAVASCDEAVEAGAGGCGRPGCIQVCIQTRLPV
jgi:hypothetical protein